MNKCSKSQKGAIEVLLILALLIVVGVGGFLVYSSTSDNEAEDNTANQTTSSERTQELSNRDIATEINRLMSITQKDFSTLSISERDEVRKEVANAMFYALDQTVKKSISVLDLDEIADDYLREYHEGLSGNYREMFDSYQATSSTKCSELPLENELRLGYDEDAGEIGTLVACLESGEIHIAE